MIDDQVTNAEHQAQRLDEIDWTRVPDKQLAELTGVSNALTKSTIFFSFHTTLMKFFLYYTLTAGVSTLVLFKMFSLSPLVLLFINLGGSALVGLFSQVRAMIEQYNVDYLAVTHDALVDKIVRLYRKDDK